MKALMIIADGYEDLEAIGTLALLRRAGIQVDVAALHGKEAYGQYDTHLVDLFPLSQARSEDYGLLVLPGGREHIEEKESPLYLSFIRSFHEAGKPIAAICAAPTILGSLGYLKGKKYTCFTSMNRDFGGTFIDTYAVRDGNLVTGRSCAAVVDFSLLIVEMVLGKAARAALEAEIYYPE